MRDRLRIRLEMALKFQKEFQRRIEMLMPVIANRLMGGDSSMSVLGEAMIGQFLASLRSEQLPTIIAALDTEQAALAAEIYKVYGEKWRKDRGGEPNEEASSSAEEKPPAPDAAQGESAD